MSQPAPEQAIEAAQPAEVTEPVAAPEPAGNAAGEEGDLGNLDFADLPDDSDAILNYLHEGGTLEIPTAVKPDAAPEVVTTPEKAPEEAAKVETPAVENLDEKLPGRISTQQFDADEQRAMRLMHALNEGKKPGDPGRVSMWDAKAQLDAMDSKGKAPVPPAEAASPVETVKTTIDDLTANLATLKQQKAEAIQNGEETGEVEDKIEAARDAIAEAKIKFTFARERAQSEQAQQAAAQKSADTAARSKAQEAVAKQFPTAVDAKLPLGAEIKAVIAELNDPSHPDNSVLHRMGAAKDVTYRALERLTEREGTSLSQQISKYEAKPAAITAPEPHPKPAAPATRKVLPASGAASTTPPKGAPTGAEILDQVGDSGDAALAALYGNRKLTHLQ